MIEAGIDVSVLAETVWRERRRRHQERLRPVIEPHVARQSRQEKHPVLDFLFEYYSFRPSWLLRWSPGLGCVLGGDGAREYLNFREYRETPAGVELDLQQRPRERAAAARWILALLETTRDRPPRFGCFGLHEWAMVYRAPEMRHAATPLRLTDVEIARFVESQHLACSHFDAFRFFTPAARPLNTLQPSRSAIPDLDQRGCLHVNMDLYKWAHKFYPWIGSDLIADAFLLAVDIREVDMRASPYDLRPLGYEPIAIETEAGRLAYRTCQEDLARRAQPIRERLIEAYRALLPLL